MVLQIEGVTASECLALVEADNNRDEWAKAHPEVILDAPPHEEPLCSYVVPFADKGPTHETVWGNGIAGRNFCFTLNFIANGTPAPAN